MMKENNCPRIVIAGLSGDSGKTFVSCGITAALNKRGLKTAGFKKGPDYIDAAWLKIASGNKARNLDTYLMDKNTVISSFTKHSAGFDISVIEGNRGLFDGFDIKGSHSTAELAKLLNAPVILTFSIKKMTRTAAAIVNGCKTLDKELNIAGIILNMVAGKRHLKIAKEAIGQETGIPVIGAIPKLSGSELFPSRHLGLITPGEYKPAADSIERVRVAAEEYIDIGKVIEIANCTESLPLANGFEMPQKSAGKIKIGYFRDKAFSFYYPDNLEALENSGAELIPVSSFEDKKLPDIDGLYIGGGFPETNIESICNNRDLMASVKEKAEEGLPVYAECGGLMYLCESILIDGYEYPLAGVFPVCLKMDNKPKGHGYTEILICRENPVFKKGALLKGHEFHYSYFDSVKGEMNFCMKMKRGKGALDKKDGLFKKNVVASYMHLHALSSTDWTKGFINCINRYKDKTK